MPLTTIRDSFGELRHTLDGSDPFMTGGHQVIRPRYAYKKQHPAWTKSDKKIRQILLQSFPKLQTDMKQRSAAARWLRIIHMYYRVGETIGTIAVELHQKVGTVKRVLVSIKRAAKGKNTANGTDRRKRGRPPKNSVPV
jgi:hypothetical protein